MKRNGFLLAWGLLLFPAAAPCAAQMAVAANSPRVLLVSDSPAPPAGPKLTSEEVQRRLRAVDDTKELPAEVKAELQKQYHKALESLKAAGDSAALAARWKTEAENAPAALEQIRQTLAQPAEARPEPLPTALLAEWEQSAEELKTDLEKAREDLAAREGDLRTRERKAELSRTIDDANRQLEELRQRSAAPVPEGENPAASIARRTESDARRIALEQQLEACRAEAAAMDALGELLVQRRDLARRRVTTLETQLAARQKEVARRRKEETQAQMDEARRALQQASPALRELSTKNADLAKERATLTAKLERAAQTLETDRKTLADLKRERAKARERIEAAGLSTTVGLMLRKQREQLPDAVELRQQLRFIQAEMPHVELRTIELKEARDDLADVDALVQRRLQEAVAAMPHYPPEALERELRQAVTNQRKYVDGLLADYGAYWEALSDQDSGVNRLLQQTSAFANFIDENILWIRSADVLTGRHIPQAGEALLSLCEPSPWLETGEAMLTEIARQPTRSLTTLGFCLAMLWLSRRLRGRLRHLAEPPPGSPFVRFTATLEAIALTAAIASVWPGVCWLIGWRLTQADVTTDLMIPLGLSLKTTAILLWPAEIVRQLFRARGLAEAHLSWDPHQCQLVRVNIRRLIVVGVPLALATSFFNTVHEALWRDSLGRLSFIAVMVLLAVVLNRLFHHRNHFVQTLLEAGEHGWLNRSRYLIQLMAMLIPVGLALASAVGYSYSAQVLADRFLSTVWFVVAVLVVRSLIGRWLFIRQWQLARHRAGQRDGAETPAGGTATGEPSATQRALAASQVTQQSRDAIRQEDLQFLVHIDRQLQQLLRIVVASALIIGGWFIWDDMFPALRALDRVELWSAGETAAAPAEPLAPAGGALTKPGGETTAERSLPERLPGRRGTTLGDVLWTLLIAVVTFLAGKNIPGLLEVLLLERLPIEKGARNALTTICGYGIMLTGLIVGCNALGLSWQNIQWFAAAMTVGLGFGLQEIFANFVSGLILLFERPIRVGDVVTLGDVTGTVTRIRIRATTITDWDRKELIVPNKDLITGRLLNWTLTDHVNRLTINVGVAYGTDTERVTNLLLDIARAHPDVMRDPEPSVTFESFGDSTLDFSLRCYLCTLEDRSTAKHELNTQIYEQFTQAGIEIAFPQRDIHIRSMTVPELTFRLPEERPGPTMTRKSA